MPNSIQGRGVKFSWVFGSQGLPFSPPCPSYFDSYNTRAYNLQSFSVQATWFTACYYPRMNVTMHKSFLFLEFCLNFYCSYIQNHPFSFGPICFVVATSKAVGQYVPCKMNLLRPIGFYAATRQPHTSLHAHNKSLCGSLHQNDSTGEIRPIHTMSRVMIPSIIHLCIINIF